MAIMSFSRIDGLVRQYISQPNGLRLKVDDLNSSNYEGNLYLGKGAEPRIFFMMWDSGFSMRAVFERPRHMRDERGAGYVRWLFNQVYSDARGIHELDISDCLVMIKFRMYKNEEYEKKMPFSELYDDGFGQAPMCVYFLNDFTKNAIRFNNSFKKM